jgi:hypothetical protein
MLGRELEGRALMGVDADLLLGQRGAAPGIR